MVLYCRVSLNAFVESFRNTSGTDSFFTLPAKGLMHIVPQEEIEYVSMLCNACLEVKLPSSVEDKEWRLASLQATDEVLYRYEHGNLIPYVPVSMPVDCLKRVYLEDFRRQPLLFGTLNGFLKSKGLPAEHLLNLS